MKSIDTADNPITDAELNDLTPDDRATADCLREGTLQELAQLSPIDYDQCRIQNAEAWGIRLSTLDAEVHKRRPQDNESNGGTILPVDVEPWPNAVDGATLLDAIRGVFTRYVVLPDGAAVTLALWVLHTFALDAADASPMLAVTSAEKRSAKTLLLEILAVLVRKAIPASNLTSSVLFRTIESFKPTLLIDEADSFLRDNEELRGVLNSGHRRGTAFVLRNVGDDHTPTMFSTFCCKAIAAIGKLPGTIEDRCIPIPMKRKGRTEKVERMRYRNLAPETADLKRQAARWAADNIGVLKVADPPTPETLNDRAGDSWRPLLAIADCAGGKWPEVARQAALRLSGGDVDDSSVGVQLLTDIKDIFERERTDKLSSETIVEELVKLEERPWVEWGKSQKPMSKPQLARVLQRYGLKPKKIRLGEITKQGYDVYQFSDAFGRYVGFQSGTPEQSTSDVGFSALSKRNTLVRVPAEITGNTNPLCQCE